MKESWKMLWGSWKVLEFSVSKRVGILSECGITVVLSENAPIRSVGSIQHLRLHAAVSCS